MLGFGSTLAEPALNALGMTVQNLTNGAFKKSMLMGAVAFGVAIGIMLGVLKLIFDFHIMYILIPGYTLGLILTLLSTEEFVNVGWDSAGVTTGPVTVPLVWQWVSDLAMPWDPSRVLVFWRQHQYVQSWRY